MSVTQTISQIGQVARITTALGVDAAFLEGFSFTESLADPFRLSCDVVCPQPVGFGQYRGSGVSIEVTSEIETGAELQNRCFHGVLTEAAMVYAAEGEYRYQLTVRPWFWVLSLGRDCRIFAAKTARQIITDVFTAAGVATDQYDMSALTDRGTIVREYCVQFEESDFAFVSRLMEEEGIYYFFSHTASSHTMHLCDAPSAHTAFTHGDLIVAEGHATIDTPHLSSFGPHLRPSVASYTLRDQHWKLFGDAREAKDAFSSIAGTIAPAVFEYPGGFAYLTDAGTTEGADFAKMRLDAENAENLVHVGHGTTFAVATGGAVKVDWRGAVASLLVIGATHRLSGQTPQGRDTTPPSLSVEIETIDLKQQYRPLRLTPKPFARGPQVAKVVGKKDEEIDVDDFGRVRVQFPWDRYGQSNQDSSCWVRVSSSWAGPHMGESFHPRVGQEVLISYIDGDMDRPVVTGRVYDSVNKRWAGGPNKTLSGIKTQTVYGKSTEDYDGAVDPPTDEPGWNHLLFDDASGKEKLWLRAQRDSMFLVYRDAEFSTNRDETELVGRHLSTEVKTGDETHKVTKGKRTTTINQNETLTVEQGNRAMTIQSGDETLTVSKGNMSTEVSMGNQDTVIKMGNQTTDVKLGDISVKADLGKIEIEAMQSITLKVGGSTVVIDQMGVTIKGMMIKTEAQMMHETKALMTQVSGSAMLTLKGGITMIN